MKKTELPAFRKQLLSWYQRVCRDLPWRRTRDPYRIWISEIMLQQTRVAAVIPYYEKFLARFPDIAALASAPEQDVLAHWAGLGYYSRARNLQKAAKQMPGGDFPSEYSAIRDLAGIGDYTAAAIASIAFELPHAVVDGNVLRVLTRLYNDPSDIASPKTRKRLAEQAQHLLDPSHPADYNQAIMELGATVCTPKNPNCKACPAKRWCLASEAGTQQQLPIKIRPQKRVDLTVRLLVIQHRNHLLLQQRGADNGQLAGFWELPTSDQIPGATRLPGDVREFSHQITHHRYSYEVIRAELKGGRKPAGFTWIPVADLHLYPLTTASRKALASFERIDP